MSPKRFRRQKLRTAMKQIKVIKSRLMEINHKLDRYVYKNEKVISVADAVKYVEEMADCKIQCCGDERSLQVIEKISRCMKSIIYEEQEGLNTTNQMPAEDIYCPSPVYSVCEENDLALNQTSYKEMEPNKETTTLDLSDDEVSINNRNEIQVEVEIHRAMSNLTIAEVQETQCSQSILDDLNDFNENNARILDNFELNKAKNTFIHNEQDKPKKDTFNKSVAIEGFASNEAKNLFQINYKTTQVAIQENPKQYLTGIKKPEYTNNTLIKTVKNNIKLKDQNILGDLNVNNAQSLDNDLNKAKNTFIHNEQGKLKYDALNKHVAFKGFSSNEATNLFEIKNKTTQVQVAIQENPKQYTTGICKTSKKLGAKDTNNTNVKTVGNSVKFNTNDENSNSTKKQTRKKRQESKSVQNAPKRKRKNSKTESMNLKLDQSVKKKGHSNNSDSKVNMEDKVVKYPNTKTADTITNNKKASKTVKTPLIYNGLVENDLSWVENIRFVREISNEEYEPFTANVDFWDDYTFPADWNENDWNF